VTDTRDPISEELTRYRELLEPLQSLPCDGATTLPNDERRAWNEALTNIEAGALDAVTAEEGAATLARVLWAATGWAEPPARIAQALHGRAVQWPEPTCRHGLTLALRFAQRANGIDQSDETARGITARIHLALGDVDAAERAASLLPSNSSDALGLRSEIAESRGRLAEAIRLRESQITAEQVPAARRDARHILAELHRATGDLEGAIALHRDNLTEFPDYAPSRLYLGLALHARGDLVEAFAEADSALLLGLEEARDALDRIAVGLDRASLDEFRRLLRGGADGEMIDLAPRNPSAGATAGAPS